MRISEGPTNQASTLPRSSCSMRITFDHQMNTRNRWTSTSFHHHRTKRCNQLLKLQALLAPKLQNNSLLKPETFPALKINLINFMKVSEEETHSCLKGSWLQDKTTKGLKLSTLLPKESMRTSSISTTGHSKPPLTMSPLITSTKTFCLLRKASKDKSSEKKKIDCTGRCKPVLDPLVSYLRL